MIRCQNLSLEYVPGKPVLRQINLHLEPGSFTFVSGASGAGVGAVLDTLLEAIGHPEPDEDESEDAGGDWSPI